MIKIAIFAAVQAVMYLLVAYIVWDLVWIVSLGEESVDLRLASVAAWASVSACACLPFWD